MDKKVDLEWTIVEYSRVVWNSRVVDHEVVKIIVKSNNNSWGNRAVRVKSNQTKTRCQNNRDVFLILS